MFSQSIPQTRGDLELGAARTPRRCPGAGALLSWSVWGRARASISAGALAALVPGHLLNVSPGSPVRVFCPLPSPVIFISLRVVFCESSFWGPPAQAVCWRVAMGPRVPEDGSTLGVWDRGSKRPRASESPSMFPSGWRKQGLTVCA